MHTTCLSLFLAFILISCATGHRDTSKQIRTFIVSGQYDEAIAYLKASSLATDEKSKLLHFTELGLIEHYRGNYEASSLALTEAKTIIDELFTTRVSGKLSSALGNDNSDFYYGEKYEASLVYFYLSLNSYMQGIQEPDEAKRKEHLLRARSEVLDWDSFLSQIKKERMGEVVFKDDLLAKVFGALVHESLGNKNDDQVALQLYKDAKDVLFKNYNLFPSYNQNYESFRKDFTLLPQLPEKEVLGKYVYKTPHSETFTNFLDSKISELTKKAKSNKNPKESSISFLIQDGLIAEKTPNIYHIPMNWGVHTNMALSMSMGQTITFELPTVVGVEKLETGKIQALDATGALVKEIYLSVVAPLGELAEQAIKEHSTAIAAKTAARVTAKHLAAFVASAATMQAARSQNNAFASILAMAGHAAAVAGINSSEKADVRFWSTLPSSIRMAHMSLPAGVYKFQAVYDSGTAQRIVDLGSKQISQNNKNFVMDNKNLRFNGVVLPLEPVRMPAQNTPETKTATVQKKPEGCNQNSDCPGGSVCATVRGEYPGSCAATGFIGNFQKAGCSNDSECGEGRVCATVRGEYPGSCAEAAGSGRGVSSYVKTSGCTQDSECGTGRVCATVRGEYPGLCAQR